VFYCDVAGVDRNVAWVVWSYFYSLFGVEWVLPSSVLGLLSGGGTLLGRGLVNLIWM